MIFVFDMNHLCHRAYWAFRNLTLEDGTPIGMVYGTFNILLSLTSKYKPKDIVLCYDGSSKKKKLISSAYKADRVPMHNGFFQQFSVIRTLMRDMGMKQCLMPEEEGDDVVATIATKLKTQDKVIIVSGDHDFLQLIDDDIMVLREGSSKKLYTKEMILDEYGIEPKKLFDISVLTGDPSDNVIGINKVGIKKAVKLIKQYGNIENILEKSQIDQNLKIVKDNLETLNINKKILCLKTDLCVIIERGNKNIELVKLLFKEHFKFNSLLKKWEEIEKLSELGGVESSLEFLNKN